MSNHDGEMEAPAQRGGTPSSRQVAYLPVYELVSPWLGDPGLIPGTPAWCQLDDTDPIKWQAMLWAAVWWSLAADTRQASLADASREISCAAATWSEIGRGRGTAYIPRKAS